MGGPALPERDLAVLRSFARRIDPSDAGAHNNLGVLYYQKGLIPEAVAEFSRALELDPRMQVAQGNLEITYRASGYYDRRVAELRERLRREAGDREARWELARAYAALGHTDEAVAEFEALLAWHPDDIPALLQLGLAEKARGRVEVAEEWFRRAAEQDPDSPVALFYHGEALYNRGLNEAALETLRQAVHRNPDYADAHYLLAFVLGDMGLHDEARASTKRAISLNPTLGRAQANLTLQPPEDGSVPGRQTLADSMRPALAEGGTLAHFNLGLAFRQKGYYAEALREYRLALDQGEDRRLTLQAMAEVHLLRRDLASALELYDALVEEHADSPKVWNERGVCLHQAGRRDAARDSYERAISLDGDYALAWNNLGVLLAHEPGTGEAEAAFRAAMKVRRDLAAPRLNLALLLFQLRRFQPALETFRSVLADEPASAAAWNGIGLVLMELHRYADARNAFARAVDASPNYASAHYNLSFTLSQLGDFDGALRATKRALELEPYYIQQKFQLSIDLQYEDPTIAIVPEISADVTAADLGESFVFDPTLLEGIFEDLAPAAPAQAAAPAAEEAALSLARDYISKGLLELASAELTRAVARGASRARVAVLLGDIYGKRGLHGEALERYREARGSDPADVGALLGEVRSLLALNRAEEAAAGAEGLAQLAPTHVEALVAVARVRLANGDPVRALDALREAQARAPGRPDLLQLQAGVSRRLGEREEALDAYQAALQLDSGLVQVWLELGSLEEERANWTGARLAYRRALDLLPTYSEAARALAQLLRRVDTPKAAMVPLIALLGADPWDLEALTLLGELLVEDGRPDKAIEAFERVLRFDPASARARLAYGAALVKVRRYREASEQWEAVVRGDPGSPLAAVARNQLRSTRDLVHILTPKGG